MINLDKEVYSVDRIESNFAVLEFPDKTFNNVALSLLPNDVKEGNILVKIENNTFIHDFDEETNRKNRLLELQSKIFR